IAADGGRCLYRLEWPDTQEKRSGIEPERLVRLPLHVREVFAAGQRLVLAGSGGPMEIHSEDGRVHLVLPDPAADASHFRAPPGPRGAVGVAPPPSQADPPSTSLLRRARRSGIGHLSLPEPLLNCAPALTAAVERARDSGLRLVADLPTPLSGRTAAE